MLGLVLLVLEYETLLSVGSKKEYIINLIIALDVETSNLKCETQIPQPIFPDSVQDKSVYA